MTCALPGVPFCTYFTQSGAAVHGAYWHNDFGHPRSHGCVNVLAEEGHFFRSAHDQSRDLVHDIDSLSAPLASAPVRYDAIGAPVVTTFHDRDIGL